MCVVSTRTTPSWQSDWYRRRTDPAHPKFAEFGSAENRRAAGLAALHADTPSLILLDSLGREVIAIAHNKVPSQAAGLANTALPDRPWLDERYLTFTKLDAEGKPLWIVDARGNKVMQYIAPHGTNHTPLYDDPNPDWRPAYDMPVDAVPCYDIAGNLLCQHSMDAGDRWMIMDAAGKPMLAWDANDRTDDTGGPVIAEQRVFRTRYDSLHRPVGQWLSINGGTPALIEAFDYCDTAGPSLPEGGSDLNAAKQRNLVGQAIRHWDPSGRATVERLDFKGGVEEITRTLVADVKAAVVDWNLTDRQARLETEVFRQITEYDALGRMTRLYNWHRGNGSRVAIYEPQYNERGALLKEQLTVRATKTAAGADRAGGRVSMAIEEVTYNEKGQKLSLALGNGTMTTYAYDAETFRLLTLKTGRHQDLSYTYDAVGNIMHIEDAAQATVYLNNSAIRPEHEYIYDAIYRLIEATGRENPNAPSPPPHPEGTWPRGPVPTADVPRNYAQRYTYDSVGNFIDMRHLPDQGTGWTRHYTVKADSNRLDRTWYNNTTADAVTYRHDPHGNMLNLHRTAPALDMRWDWRDMIRALDLQGGGDAFYNYGIDKQRTRKRIEHRTRAGAGAANPHAGTTEDRIYLGGYELYRRRISSGAVVEEIESLHLFEGEQRVLLVDDVISTRDARPDGLAVPEQTLWRYQYGNHLGSVGLELDDTARVISYEEFHPYGTSAYRLINSAVEAPPRRYRYTGMERDEESGLNYHAARYYVAWLGRWTGGDPKGTSSGINLYLYASATPMLHVDRDGMQDGPMCVPLTIGKYSDVRGHHVMQSASYTPRSGATDPFHSPTLAVSQTQGAFTSGGHSGSTTPAQSAINRAAWSSVTGEVFNETVGVGQLRVETIEGSAAASNLKPQALAPENVSFGRKPQVVSGFQGSGKLPPTATPFFEEVKALNSLSYASTQVPPDQARVLVEVASRQREALGSVPQRVPNAPKPIAPTAPTPTTTPTPTPTTAAGRPPTKAGPVGEPSSGSVAASFAGQYAFMWLWSEGREKTMTEVVRILNMKYEDVSTEERNFMIDVGFLPEETIFDQRGVKWEKTWDREIVDRVWLFMHIGEILIGQQEDYTRA